jgi:hypothetical protein
MDFSLYDERKMFSESMCRFAEIAYDTSERLRAYIAQNSLDKYSNSAT